MLMSDQDRFRNCPSTRQEIRATTSVALVKDIIRGQITLPTLHPITGTSPTSDVTTGLNINDKQSLSSTSYDEYNSFPTTDIHTLLYS